MRDSSHISFYLRSTTIHIHRSTIRSLGNPHFIRFLISKDEKTLLVQTYPKKDFQSFRVPKPLTDEIGRVQIHSKGFCQLIQRRLGWDETCSYRIPGKSYLGQGVAAFDLEKAVRIETI